MRKIYSIVVLCSLVISLRAQEIKNKTELVTANATVNNYLKKLIAKEEGPGPVEYREARKLYHYDINQDGEKDLVAFYTLESYGGGNNWGHCIAIFIMEKGRVKAVDNFTLFGDAWKVYHDGELVGFKNGFVHYKLYGVDRITRENFSKNIGFTMKNSKIVTNVPF